MTTVGSWAKANRWALVAVAVLGAASVWWSFAWDWAGYQSHRPTQIVDVPRDKQATYSGAVFSIADVDVLEGDSSQGARYGVAEGTDVVVVDLSVTPREGGDPEDTLLCEVRLQAPSSAGTREWWPESSNPTSYPDGDPDVFGCNIAGGPRYELREFFVVPAGGADSDAMLQVTLLEELPLALRLHL